MSKKTFTSIIIILLIALAIVFGIIYSKRIKNNNPATPNSGSLLDFLPFTKNILNNGNGTTPNNNTIDLSGEMPTDSDQLPAEKLVQITNLPVAGYGIFLKERYKEIDPIIPDATNLDIIPEETTEKKPTPPEKEFVTALRYVERATGNIYQTFADEIDLRKFTSTTIPKIYEAYFADKGNSVIMRYLKNNDTVIETLIGKLPKEVLGGDTQEDNEIIASFLPENITDLSISADGSKLFYLFNNENYTVGITADGLGDKKSQVFNSPFNEWLSWWPNNETITLNTKPSFNVPGYMYVVNPNKKDFHKVLGDIDGLTTLTSPSGEKVLYADNSLALNIFNREDGSFYSTGARTLPEKCIWNKNSTYVYCAVPNNISQDQYPDSWYKGKISFEDSLWKINIENRNASLISDLIQNGQQLEIDAIKLQIDENEDFLFFINKKDSSLWEFNLK